ncbi:MAG: viroplasmin family protein [Blautia sp.]|nr:viroplasmin family protein [Blautia sp.]
MAKKKYYAVKQGKMPGVYFTWDECKAQTEGFSGAQFKSFSTLEEAEKYVKSNMDATGKNPDDSSKENISEEELNKRIEKQINTLSADEVIAFVDGSYVEKSRKSGFGVIIISEGGNRDLLYKAFTENLGKEFIELRNVAAELEGVKEAINWAITYGKRKITIFYDYDGIEKWTNGEWKAEKNLTKQYSDFISKKKKNINIEFVKVPAHSGIELNEEADALAKRSLLEKGFKTYNDGSIYFVGYGIHEWTAIVDNINEENMSLEKDIPKLTMTISELSNRHRIEIIHQSNKVVINCYANYRSYVQGKQSVLFQKIIATAVESLKNDETVIETLNYLHALSITENEAEREFEKLLPNYNGPRNGKHYHNLLSSVYNTLLTGYMPDYTCLVTPIFRAYEYYLHEILGKKMELTTTTEREYENGDKTVKNNFSYFSRNESGKYECNNPAISKLTDRQADFLNELYTKYRKVRHPFSHWSADENDTAVITEIVTARDYLIEGLEIIDQYYLIF